MKAKNKNHQGKLNINRGKRFEREIVNQLKELGYKDAKRILEFSGGNNVDIRTSCLNIQCKNTQTTMNYYKILSEMPKDSNYNIIFQKINKYKSENVFAILPLDDFFQILEMLKAESIFS